MKLKNKSVVVTGASSGMGKAIVELFVKEGASVVAVARRSDRLEELVKSLASESGKVVAFVGDISAKETNEQMIDKAIEEFGKLDVLINNAGVMDDMSPIGEVTDEKYQKVMNINVYGPMCSMRKAVEVFKLQSNGGSVINISSLGARRTFAGPIYGASKAALDALTKNSAYMYMPDKIRFNSIAPGGIKTEIATSMGMPNMNGYGRVQTLLAVAPEPGEASDIANVALFLASEESNYISGTTIDVDGGWNAG